MIATRATTYRRTQRAETRVAKFLWGAGAQRDWKERHDVSGTDADGAVWLGEVKSDQWPSGPRAVWGILNRALDQVLRLTDRGFAVYLPKHSEVGDALVMVEEGGRRVVMTLAQFRERLAGGVQVWAGSGRASFTGR